MCVIFSTVLSGELHDTELRGLWEKGNVNVMDVIALLPSLFQQDS